MEIVPALPLDLLAVAAPQSRVAPGFLRVGDTEGEAAVPLLPFDALLAQLLAEPPPAGENLPETGNGLPILPAGLPLLGLPAPPSSAAETVLPAAGGPQPPGPAAHVFPFRTPSADAALSPPPPAPAELPEAPAARPMDWPSSAAAPEPAPLPAELPAVDADGAPAAGTDRLAPPDARPAHTAPAPFHAELTEPQPAARVLAALAAAASAPAERGAPRAPTKTAPAGADRAAAPSGPQVAAFARDAGDLAPLARALDLPQPVVAADVPAAAIETSRGSASHPQAIFAAPADAAAPLAATLGQALVPNVGGAPTPTTVAAHAPAAHPHGSVDTTAARWHDALASRIHWLVDHDLGEARIKLNPPELGALDVKISLQDDKTFVQLTAATSAARDELTQSLPRLRELLSANGLELGGATVSGGRDQRSAPYAQAERSLTELDASGAIGAAQPRRAGTAASSQIDVFA